MKDRTLMDWGRDWDLAIKRNSEALKGIIADLFVMLDVVTGSRICQAPLPRRAADPPGPPNPPCAA